MKAGPVDLGPAGEDWTDNVRPIIEARMQKYQQGEIHFNLMALIQDRTVRYNNQLKSLSGMSIDSQMSEVILEVSKCFASLVRMLRLQG